MIYFYISTAIFIGGIFIAYWLHNQYHLDIVVQPAPLPSNAALISVCVPARNEERNIRPCVETLLAQDYPHFEVIVLDDRSTDVTPEILGKLLMESDSIAVASGCALSTRIRFSRQLRSLPVTQKLSRLKPICSRS